MIDDRALFTGIETIGREVDEITHLNPVTHARTTKVHDDLARIAASAGGTLDILDRREGVDNCIQDFSPLC
jgi:hypothetical protein